MVDVATTVKGMFNSAAFFGALTAACAADKLKAPAPVNQNGEYLFESAMQLAEGSHGFQCAADVHVPPPRCIASPFVYEAMVQALLSLVCGAPAAQVERRMVARYADALYRAVVAMNWRGTYQGTLTVVNVQPAGEDPSGVAFRPEGPIYERVAQTHFTLQVIWPETGD